MVREIRIKKHKKIAGVLKRLEIRIPLGACTKVRRHAFRKKIDYLRSELDSLYNDEITDEEFKKHGHVYYTSHRARR